MTPQKAIKKAIIKKAAYASSRIEGYPKWMSPAIRAKAMKLLNGHK